MIIILIIIWATEKVFKSKNNATKKALYKPTWNSLFKLKREKKIGLR